jgi:hypothetical protein
MLLGKFFEKNQDSELVLSREEIETMIEFHHKMTSYRRNREWLVEPFRKADWIDITYGSLRFGLTKSDVHQAFSAFPSAGFHRGLISMTKKRLITHPFRPLPMIKL